MSGVHGDRPRVSRSIVARLALVFLAMVGAAIWGFVAAALHSSRAPFLVVGSVVLLGCSVPFGIGTMRAYRTFTEVYGSPLRKSGLPAPQTHRPARGDSD
jgi:hypothetical protein